jgi:hypothetical protein
MEQLPQRGDLSSSEDQTTSKCGRSMRLIDEAGERVDIAAN